MKILFLGEAISPHLLRWQKSFEKLGWETKLASCDSSGDFDGIRLQPKASSGVLKYLSVVDQVGKIVADFQPHLINAHFLPNYGLVAALLKAHPWVMTLWGSDILVSGRQGMFRRWRSRYVLKHADMVVADSQFALDTAASISPLQRHLVVSFGVRKSWFESGSLRVLKEERPIKILSTRRLEPLYDVATLLKAARLLLKSDVPFTLTIAGGGTQQAQLESLSQSFGLDTVARFTGPQSEEQLFNLYRTHDIYVSTARSDSSSVSMLEALSQKLYPVVTDIPGNHEWLDDPRFLFPVGDAETLAARVSGGIELIARQQAWDYYRTTLERKGIREDQMLIADRAFRKLIEEYDRHQPHSSR